MILGCEIHVSILSIVKNILEMGDILWDVGLSFDHLFELPSLEKQICMKEINVTCQIQCKKKKAEKSQLLVK